jgi:hypothetical protein
LGLETVPTVRLSQLTPVQARAYILADNWLEEKPGWDKEILAIELQGLIDLDFEVDLTGFEVPETDVILDDADGAKREAAGPENEVPELHILDQRCNRCCSGIAALAIIRKTEPRVRGCLTSVQ